MTDNNLYAVSVAYFLWLYVLALDDIGLKKHLIEK